jgi:phenylacetate-coenzyme A ligase PaaK-like adenylate-forming protein
MTATTPVATGFDKLRAWAQAELLVRAPEHIERLGWSRQQIEATQREGLRALLGHAIENSPFHRRRLRRIDPSQFDLPDLRRLPIMTKAEMMASLDDVFTDRGLNRQLVEGALAATAAEPVPILGHYTALASGGVSGQRGVFVSNPETMVGSILSLSRSSMARLAAVGGPPPERPIIAIVAAASAVHGSRSAVAWNEGSALAFRMVAVPVTLTVTEMVERLNALQPSVLTGYPSVLARLATEQRAGRLRIAPRSVTSSSETLVPEVRAAIAQAFGAPIADQFGSSEGLIGMSAPNDDVLVFNSDLCIVELVDAENRPLTPGVPSAKVLLTNLYNRTQPLIRYELTDSFVRQPDASEHGHLRAKVRGRADEILHFDGVDIHPHIVRSVMVRSPEILDYRVRQTPRGIEVEALAIVPLDSDRVAERLEQTLGEAGLTDPFVSVRVVDHLERLRDTGKLRRFIPLPSVT